jgi:hypothetical protein
MSGALSTAQRLAGIATMSIDGDPWDVVGDLAWQTTKVQRETLKGQTAVEGFSEMPMQGMISARLRDRPDETVQSLNFKTNSTIVVIQANGKTIQGYNMWSVEVGEVNTQEGTFTIKFEGADVDESTV